MSTATGADGRCNRRTSCPSTSATNRGRTPATVTTSGALRSAGCRCRTVYDPVVATSGRAIARAAEKLSKRSLHWVVEGRP
jgi:hypothetical protein